MDRARIVIWILASTKDNTTNSIAIAVARVHVKSLSAMIQIKK